MLNGHMRGLVLDVVPVEFMGQRRMVYGRMVYGRMLQGSDALLH